MGCCCCVSKSCEDCCDPCCKRLGCGCKSKSGEKFADIEKNRSCTDVPCVILFIIFIAGCVGYVWGDAYARGDPDRILRGVDFDGNICGKGVMSDFKFAYWPEPTTSFRFKVCIDDCDNVSEYPAKEFYDRYCLPDADETDIEIQGYDSMSGWASRGIADLKEALPVIGVSLIIATLMAFFFIWLMKCCVGCLVWGTIFAIIIGGFLASLSFLYKAKNTKETGDKNGAKIQQGIGYTIAAVTFIFMCLIIFARNRIRIAVAVIKSASRAIGDMPLIVFFPIWPILLLGGFFIAWLYASLWIFSTADNTTTESPDDQIGDTYYTGTDAQVTVGNEFKIKDYDTARSLFAPHFFCLLWVNQILIYFTFTVLAGAIADWYFTERDEKGKKKRGTGKGELTPSPVKSSCCRTFRYHLGSIMYAALLIAIIQFIRWCIRYMERMANGGKKPNRLQRLLFKLVDCLLWCLECCLDKISRNALIFVAIYGDAFCPAVCDSFKLVWANLFRVAAISFFSTIVTTLGKIFVPIMTTGLCGLAILYLSPYKNDVSQPTIPLVVIFIISLALGMIFIVVYDTAIDTVFLCFLIDEKHNKNNGKMLADDDLRSIVQKFEKQSKEIADSMQNRSGATNDVAPDTGVDI